MIPDIKGARKGTIVHIIDIKNDYSGSWQEASYKAQHYKTPGCAQDSEWDYKVVENLPYKEYTHLRLVRKVIDWYAENRDRTY